jgi:predicted permease
MDGKSKIEALTNSWYGFALFASIYSVLTNGLGFFTILFALGSTAFSFFLTWFIGRRLLKKSSLTRVICIVVSGISSVLGTLGTAKTGLAFFNEWSISLLLTAVFGVIVVTMHVRSFRVLTSSEVKAYYR